MINPPNIAQKTLVIFTHTTEDMELWDPDSIHTGIQGSEEAVIYMSKELAKIGYKVIVLGNHPINSIHSSPEANPRFVTWNNYSFKFKVDIGIAWRRIAERVKELKDVCQLVYLWPHDLLNESLTDSQINEFEDVFWLSQWQRNQWVSENPGFEKFTKIFGNGINPEQFQPIQERENPYACIYASSYTRGLRELLIIWPQIKNLFPKATLDIYYGWQPWYEYDEDAGEEKLRARIDSLKNLDVNEHGRVGHVELNQAYQRASFWTYPLIFHENFSISALRAQFSGAIPVIVSNSGLNETVRFGYRCKTIEDYLTILTKAMKEAESININDRKKMREFILKEYTWEIIAKKWAKIFDSSIRNQQNC